MNQNSREITARAYETLLTNFVDWAQDQDDIRSAMVIGSRARADHPADEFSDLDLSIFVKNPPIFLDNPDWLLKIGVPWLTFVERTGDRQHWERRCLFEGGLDVDFAFVPSTLVIEMVEDGLSPEIGDVFKRGYKILFDKDNLLERVSFETGSQKLKPPFDEKAFLDIVNDFWYHSVWTAKHLRRGELWWAKECCDSYLKGLLRRVMEWQAQATSSQDKDTWMRGRFLEEWVDPRALQALKTVYASYDLEDVWRALLETMDLFEWMSLEVVKLQRISYPETGVSKSKAFVVQLYQQRR
jgi:aminoglycoside 6-adenylyltransferase